MAANFFIEERVDSTGGHRKQPEGASAVTVNFVVPANLRAINGNATSASPNASVESIKAPAARPDASVESEQDKSAEATNKSLVPVIKTIVPVNANGPIASKVSNEIVTNGTQTMAERRRNVGENGLSVTNLYIRGLDPAVSDQDLVKLCAPYGRINSIKTINESNVGRYRGFAYGFVDFENKECAKNAIKGLSARGIQAQMAKAGTPVINRRHPVEQDPTNLYFANLPLHYDEASLEALIADFGNVISTRILKEDNNVSKGVGFARMESQEICESIIHCFNGTSLPGSREPLLVKYADGGPRRRHHHHHHRNGDRNWREIEGNYRGHYENRFAAPANPVSAQVYGPFNYQCVRHFAPPTQYILHAAPHPLQPVAQIAPPPMQQLAPVEYQYIPPPEQATYYVPHTYSLAPGPSGAFYAAPHPSGYPYCAGATNYIHTVPVAPVAEEFAPPVIPAEEYQAFPYK